MKYYSTNLGDEAVDTIIKNIMTAARSLFPEQTSEFEAWVTARLAAYGIDYAKYRAQQLYGTATDWFSSPVILLGLGLLGGYLVFKR